jgi:hypothetical protein
LLQLGDEAAARHAWLALHKVDPMNGYACHALGVLDQQDGLLEASETWFRRGCSCSGALLCEWRYAGKLWGPGCCRRAEEVVFVFVLLLAFYCR